MSERLVNIIVEKSKALIMFIIAMFIFAITLGKVKINKRK